MKNRTIIIAEIGVNHNGNVTLAKKLIDVAKKSGADFVKFQTFKTENLVCKNTKAAKYQNLNLKRKTSQYNILKKLELKDNDFKTLLKYSKKRKIGFLSSPFDLDSLELLLRLKIFDIKVASGEITHYIFLKKLAKFAKRVFLSTGMSTIEEVSKAINILVKGGMNKKNITILHCHTNYPTEFREVNLRAMKSMENKFNIDVGYSDHTIGEETAIAAVALGAKVIEKHITLSKKMIGPDHKASMEPSSFIKYVKAIRNTEHLMGSNIKKPTKNELKIRKLVRKSIIAKKPIKKGELFSSSNLICKRPEGGISPIHWDKIIGRKSKKDFKVNQFIRLK